MQRVQVFLLAVSFAYVFGAPTGDAGDKLTLRIIHTNDMHSRFEEISQSWAPCSEKEASMGRCYGGFARVATIVRNFRASATADNPVFFLNAGDTYQGSKLYSFYKWKIVARFMNILRPDVTSLGNHEFDDKVAGLVPYLNNISFPVVAANLDLSREPELENSRALKKSHILKAKNQKIGVIGYLTSETILLSQPGNVIFQDEVAAISKEAKKLKEQGCNIIIALGHSGFEIDKKIAREVEDVDLVIGGHTNTFLYNGPQPDSEVPEGFYPTEIIQPSGRKTYVVQAMAYTKYVGNLTVDFDSNGEITNIIGNPILVDNNIPKDEEVEREVQAWASPVKNLGSKVIGSTKVLLQSDYCRLRECNFGNLLTDAMIYYNTKQFQGDNGWTDAAIAVHQSGGIRSSISTLNDEKVTKDDVTTAFPFGTKIGKARVTGQMLRNILEWSVQDRISFNTTLHGGAFLQMSGIQVTYNLSQPNNSRVVSVKVRCNMCSVPSYDDLNPDTTYSILINEFMRNGGDGFTMLKDLEFKNLNITVADVVSNYINETGPVFPGTEGRITLLYDPDTETSYKSSSSRNIERVSIFLLIFKCLALAKMF